MSIFYSTEYYNIKTIMMITKFQGVNTMQKNIFLSCFFLFFLSCTTSKYYMKNSYDIIEYNQLSSDELVYISKTMPQNNYIIIDLRPAELYQQDHIKHALSVPYKNLAVITNIPKIYSSKIVFYDKDSLFFFKIKKDLNKELKKIDISDFKILQGGFSKWTNENYPTIKYPTNFVSTNTTTNNYI